VKCLRHDVEIELPRILVELMDALLAEGAGAMSVVRMS
jgi:hypothetical protein